MEIIAHKIYRTQFILGHRVDPSEKIGVVIVKGTFKSLENPSPVSKNEQVEIFKKDEFFQDSKELRYESDFVPFKPFVDVIAITPMEIAEWPERADSITWRSTITTNIKLERSKNYELSSEELPFYREAIFGWAARSESPRINEAGDLKNYKPGVDKGLPDSFQNLFYNGFERGITRGSSFSQLESGGKLTVQSDFLVKYEDGNDKQFNRKEFTVQLPAAKEFPSAQRIEMDDHGVEQVHPIPMVLDTVIIEFAIDRCLLLWRGSWSFNDDKADQYKKVIVN